MNDLARVTQLDRDKTALANPQSAKQVMEIGDRAARLSRALKGMKSHEDEYYKAFEIMIQAYRVMGTELSQMDRQQHGRPENKGSSTEPLLPTLADLGITKKQSYEWQNIALVPQDDVEEYIEAKRKESEPVTKAAIIAIADEYKSADRRLVEEMQKLINSANSFCIHASNVTGLLRKYPMAGAGIPKDFHEQLKTWAEAFDTLNKVTL